VAAPDRKTAKLIPYDLTMISNKPGEISKPFDCNLHAILYAVRTWGHNKMLDGLYDEETALRRRFLFRLLRDFNFDKPLYRGEAISDPVPRALITTEYLRYDLGHADTNQIQC
jgi:hypothetical protein